MEWHSERVVLIAKLKQLHITTFFENQIRMKVNGIGNEFHLPQTVRTYMGIRTKKCQYLNKKTN